MCVEDGRGCVCGVCEGWKRVCACVEDGRGCVCAWRMEEGVCVCGGWNRDGKQRKQRKGGEEEREERYDDGGKIAFI